MSDMEELTSKIIKNAIRCLKCNTVIESLHVHHFVRCPCKECFVDGGHDYLRRGFNGPQEQAYEELCEYEEGSHEELCNIWSMTIDEQ